MTQTNQAWMIAETKLSGRFNHFDTLCRFSILATHTVRHISVGCFILATYLLEIAQSVFITAVCTLTDHSSDVLFPFVVMITNQHRFVDVTNVLMPPVCDWVKRVCNRLCLWRKNTHTHTHPNHMTAR